MSRPVVAVAMSCYNGEAFVRAQVQSVFSQALPVRYLSVWDDGSADRTHPQLVELAAQHPGMHVARGATNLGVNRGFQAALDACPPSDWYAFCDQDDVWPADRIAQFWAVAQRCPVDEPRLLVCQFVPFEGEPPTAQQARAQTSAQLLNHGQPDVDWQRSLLAANPLYGCCFFFNDALRRLIGDVPAGKTTHDYWVALLAAYFGRIEVLPFVGTFYRQHAANATFGAPRSNWGRKLGTLSRSLSADRRSRQDMVPLLQGLLQHPQAARLTTTQRRSLEQALSAYHQGGWAVLRFQTRHGAWSRRLSQNLLRVFSCITQGLHGERSA